LLILAGSAADMDPIKCEGQEWINHVISINRVLFEPDPESNPHKMDPNDLRPNWFNSQSKESNLDYLDPI
jgi:hypothetical protein